MKRTLIFAIVSLASLVAGTAQAGWWHHHRHHHHYYPAYPAYMPVYQPMQVVQGQAQSGIGEALLIEMIRRFVPSPGTGNNPGIAPPNVNIDTSGLRSELADIKASLKNLDARVENVNSTVQAHGEAFGLIMTELKEIRSQSPGIKTKSKEDLLKTINADTDLRDRLDALFQGIDADEKAKSRDAAIKALIDLMNK